MKLLYLALANIAIASRPQAVLQLDLSPEYQPLPPLRQQAAIQDAWTAERKAGIPSILQKYNVDAWIISQREYAEDTVFWSLKSAQQFSARRRTTYLFLAHNSSSPSFAWVDNTPSLWPELERVLGEQEHEVEKIAVNTHPEIAFSSGLHAGELDAVKKGLGKDWASRLVSEPMVAVEYVATMPSSRAGWYAKLQETAWAVIGEAFSGSVIEPGRTTTEDVEWWMREKLSDLKYGTWFHPSVSVVDEAGFFGSEGKVIEHGDLLHVDFGVTAMGMNTDTQHLGYVLRPGEDDVPEGLKEGLKKGNKAQDIVKANMKIGMTGNEILKRSLEDMKAEGIEGRVYSHPIGDWGHAAGALIDEIFLYCPNMYYSVELMVEHFVPERNATLQFPLEEDIRHVGGDEWVWAFGRQEKFHLVRSEARKIKSDEL
ncbi:hypothetical protein QBC42DRAFT_319699 [Cladorrhinum samala]|uniref:Peptidase M24 domain-containing protein n=1 Tax=Cladorrhinum samala TaxID=585594 RepID=A0AAV9HDL2_9PEZI|nr:hypothetical protein QBC42DRAFT_319699 [Cladorrhinum samala]